MKLTPLVAVVALLIAGSPPPVYAAGGAAPTPYWASLAAGQARMRTGPGRNYPVSWFYKRQGLPIRVIEIYPGWRKVRDQDGTEGWMIGDLISAKRSGIVIGGIAELREEPNAAARILWRAEPGVIGALSKCDNGWCRLDVQGRGGFIEQTRLWGVDPGEEVR